MTLMGSGVLELTLSSSTHRAKLFPLPLLAPACRPPSRSARVRRHHQVHRWIVDVTNRCIASLNTLYCGSAVQPVFICSFLSCPVRFPTQPDNSSFCFVSSHCFGDCTSSSSVPPLVATSKMQFRLLSLIREQCATFVSCARSVHSVSFDGMDASVPEVLVSDILSSFPLSLASSPMKRVSPDTRHSHFSSNISHLARTGSLSPSFISLEGPLAPSDWSSVPLPTTSTFSSAATAVVPLCASRVALPSSLNIIPLTSVLPPAIAQRYSAGPSSDLLRSELEVFELNLSSPLAPPRVAGTRKEYVALIRLMLPVGMLGFTAAPKAVNGLFTVGKDEKWDRLIIDAQPANRLFVPSPYVHLPDPSHLVQLQVPDGATMFVGKSDLSDYYHHLGLLEWMQPYFALPPLTTGELTELGLPTDAPFPMCLTLPMGFAHAVFLANTGHEHILYSSLALRPEDNLLRLACSIVTADRVIHGIEIDDFFVFSLNQSLSQLIFDRVLAAYRAVGLVVKDYSSLRILTLTRLATAEDREEKYNTVRGKGEHTTHHHRHDVFTLLRSEVGFVCVIDGTFRDVPLRAIERKREQGDEWGGGREDTCVYVCVCP
jgi:hypothetical protein